ncbi:hypothetical protein FRC01_002193, partial [Tulasnella sp. 417]
EFFFVNAEMGKVSPALQDLARMALLSALNLPNPAKFADRATKRSTAMPIW